MNPLDDHELLLWAMRAGLTRDEVRQAVRGGLDAGNLPRQTAHETEAQRQERMRAVYDYLQDRYLAGYDDYVRAVQARNAQGIQEEPMAPWQWRSLPSHARARWLGSQHVEQFDTDEYGRLQAGPEWVHRKGQEHLFDIHAITEASFLGRTPEGDIVSTWEPSKVMKRIQMLGAHEQVGFTDAPTIRGAVKAGPASPMAGEFRVMQACKAERVRPWSGEATRGAWGCSMRSFAQPPGQYGGYANKLIWSASC
jgi:hypothetical protein